MFIDILVNWPVTVVTDLRDELVCRLFPTQWGNVGENREPGCRGWFESSGDEPHSRVQLRIHQTHVPDLDQTGAQYSATE